MPRPDPFPASPIMHGDGFTLRPWRAADAVALAAATHDPEIRRWTAMPVDLDAAAAADWLLGVNEHAAEGQLAYFAIADAEGQAVGAIGVGSFDWRNDSGEVFYWIAPEARRRGLATRALRLVAGWAFGGLGLARLDLTTHPDNVASQRVAERAGFRREGLQRSKRIIRGERWDLVLFSLLPGDPRVGPLDRASPEEAAGQTEPVEPEASVPTWICFLHPPREDFAATMSDAERSVWAAHWERLRRLHREGSIVLVGPTLGRINTGVLVFEAPDEAAARRFVDEDPTVTSGFARAELRPFRLSLLRGRDG